MKKYQSLIYCLIIFLGVALSGAAFAETAPSEVLSAADAGLFPFLEELPSSEWEHFGFAPEDKISDARLGNPFHLYTIIPSALLNAKADTPVNTLITPTGLWYFPVMIENQAKTILVVDKMQNGWEAVSLGMAPLVRELQKLKRQWSKAKGYNPKLVAIFQASAFFFTIPEKDSNNFTSLIFDGIGYGGYYQKSGPEYSSTTTLSQMLKSLQAEVEKNINLKQ